MRPIQLGARRSLPLRVGDNEGVNVRNAGRDAAFAALRDFAAGAGSGGACDRAGPESRELLLRGPFATLDRGHDSMNSIVLAFSGGLDTSFAAVWLREELGIPVVTVTADTGGVSGAEADAIRARATEVGALRHIHVDARSRVYDGFISYLVKGNCLRGGVYPMAVGAGLSVLILVAAAASLIPACRLIPASACQPEAARAQNR